VIAGCNEPIKKINVANLLFLVLGYEKPSSRTRVLQVLDSLKARGHHVDVDEIPRKVSGRFNLLRRVRRYDLVFLQKKLFNTVQVAALRRANPNLVYDLDDAVMFHELERGEPVRGKYFQRFAYTASACRGVIAGNTYLADYARAARSAGLVDDSVIVLPTPIDTDQVTERSPGAGNTLTVGWIGTKGNLQHLQSISDALGQARSRCPDLRLKVVADAEPSIDGIPMEFKRWCAEDEVEDLHSFDIGLMPLNDNLWTRGKGGYKLLQYMAAGVPAIASPVGINREIISDGIDGLLADGQDQWADAIARLANDPELRTRMGAQARQTVERRFSLAVYRQRFAEFLEGLL
jgi:glycosyltransferase involved in cell wall biosynthesis